MRLFFLFLVLLCGFYLSNKLPINPGGAGPDPPLIPLSGSARTALSDIDTNQKANNRKSTEWYLKIHANGTREKNDGKLGKSRVMTALQTPFSILHLF